MNNLWERITGIHVDDEFVNPEDKLNDVEVLNAADYDGSEYEPAQQSDDNYNSGATDAAVLSTAYPISTILLPSTSFNAARFANSGLSGLANTKVKIADRNMFRIRLQIMVTATTSCFFGTREQIQAAASSNITSQLPQIQGNAAGTTPPVFINTTAEVWVASSGFLDITVIQEFMDGGILG